MLLGDVKVDVPQSLHVHTDVVFRRDPDRHEAVGVGQVESHGARSGPGHALRAPMLTNLDPQGRRVGTCVPSDDRAEERVSDEEVVAVPSSVEPVAPRALVVRQQRPASVQPIRIRHGRGIGKEQVKLVRRDHQTTVSRIPRAELPNEPRNVPGADREALDGPASWATRPPPDG